MPLPTCHDCLTHRAEVKRPQTGHLLCRNCFFKQIEEEVHQTILSENMFHPGEIVVSGASGGKDSTVLLHLLTLLNARHSYQIDIRLLSIDEGIAGYRDDSISTVHDNAKTYDLPLHILSYSDLFGWTMDEIVRQVGVRNSCTYCGILRRQALERGATQIGATVIATGHNADDNAETILMNLLRADLPRLLHSTSHPSPTSGTTCGGFNPEAVNASLSSPRPALRRVKPLHKLYQKDIVLYARHKQLFYFSTECTYAHEAFRGTVRNLLKRLEVIHPRCIAQIAESGASLVFRQGNASSSGEHSMACCEKNATAEDVYNETGVTKKEMLHSCISCGAATTQQRCRACLLLASLEHKNGSPLPKSVPKRFRSPSSRSSSKNHYQYKDKAGEGEVGHHMEERHETPSEKVEGVYGRAFSSASSALGDAATSSTTASSSGGRDVIHRLL